MTATYPIRITLIDGRSIDEKGRFNAKVSCIKAVRQISGVGLKEAKDAVEALFSRRQETVDSESGYGYTYAATHHTPIFGKIVVLNSIPRQEQDRKEVNKAVDVLFAQGIQVADSIEYVSEEDQRIAELQKLRAENMELKAQCESFRSISENYEARFYNTHAELEKLKEERQIPWIVECAIKDEMERALTCGNYVLLTQLAAYVAANGITQAPAPISVEF